MTFHFVTEPTLCVANLVGVIEKITSDEKRRDVWENMLDDDSMVDEIYMKHATSKKRADTLADVYVNMSPESSWQYVVRPVKIKARGDHCYLQKFCARRASGWERDSCSTCS